MKKFDRVIALDVSLEHTGVVIKNNVDGSLIEEQLSFKPVNMQDNLDECMEMKFNNFLDSLEITDKDLILFEDNRFSFVSTRAGIWQTYFMKASIFHLITKCPNIKGINNRNLSSMLKDILKNPDLKDKDTLEWLKLTPPKTKNYTYNQSIVKKAISLKFYEIVTKKRIEDDNIADARAMIELYERNIGKWQTIKSS